MLCPPGVLSAVEADFDAQLAKKDLTRAGEEPRLRTARSAWSRNPLSDVSCMLNIPLQGAAEDCLVIVCGVVHITTLPRGCCSCSSIAMNLLVRRSGLQSV
jgi:hypothetical protein